MCKPVELSSSSQPETLTEKFSQRGKRLRALSFELAAAFAEEHDVDGFEEDADLEEEGHVLDVKEVILKLFNGIFD